MAPWKPDVVDAAHARLPFGMTGEEPVFERATALAKGLFGEAFTALVIIDEGRVVRRVGPEATGRHDDPGSARVITTGAPVWIEDLSQEPSTADHRLVSGGPRLRLFAGAPVRLPDGDILGALSVVASTARPRDETLLANLQRLADMVADECAGAQGRERLAERERALAQTQRRLSALMEASPLSIAIFDRDLRLLDASRSWFAQTSASGLTREQTLGMTPYEISPSYFERFRDLLDRCLAGEVIRAEAFSAPRPEGGRRWWRMELIPWHEISGEVGGLLTAAIDVSDMVEAMEKTERSEQRLLMAAQLADLHVWELDYRKQSLETAGAPEALIGRNLGFADLALDSNDTIDPRDRERVADDWLDAVLNDRPYVAEYRINRPDREVWVASSVKLQLDPKGRPLRLTGAIQNITGRKQAEAALLAAKEEAEHANRAKSAFLATMSHEIRTPLNGVLGMAQAIAADSLSPVQRERLDVIRQSGETLLAILNDVLDLSKIEAGKMELEVAAFDLEDLARGAYAAFTALAQKKGLSFNLVIEPDARGGYLGDSTRLRQIIYNLVSNALKFTEVGQVQVGISRVEGLLSIRVSDTGMGIPARTLERLFDKFEQADATTTRRFGGSGLGLAICRELADLMGGAVRVESREGEGSTFTVELPLERIDATPGLFASPPVGPEATTEPMSRPIRLLAAEDNAVNQLVLKTLLHQAGVDPTIVPDGLQALEAWRNAPWDLILMDVQMPVMDGPTAARLIREEEAATGRARTPILALTANTMSHQIAEYLRDMDDVIPKPLEAARLYAAVDAALDRADAD